MPTRISATAIMAGNLYEREAPLFGVRFETAVLVFDDPYAITVRDVAFEDEQRWITVATVGPGAILLVVHAFYEEQGEEVIRVISARAAESHAKGKLMRKLTKQQKRDIRAVAAKRNEDIDFSDTTAVVDRSQAEIGKFYRPTKMPVTMRLDSDIIAWLKADGRGYQTKANWLLRHAMLHSTRNVTSSNRGNVRQRSKGRRRRKTL
jgi:uncharacterized protein (DUF4415 family)